MASEGQRPDEINASEMKAFERELRALVPRGPNIELAKMMYLAGQASLSPVPPLAPIAASPPWNTQWLWPVSTAVAATAAAWLGVLLFLSNHRESLPKPQPRMIVQPHPPVTLPVPVAVEAQPVSAVAASDTATEKMTAADAHYLRAREKALAAGVDALAETNDRAQPETAQSQPRSPQTNAVERELGIRRSVRGGWGLFGF